MTLPRASLVAAEVFNIVCPAGYDPSESLVAAHKDRVTVSRDPIAAVSNADLVVTDVWASMGQEEEQREREQSFEGFQVNPELMAHAADNAMVVVVLFCLHTYSRK